MGYSNTGEEGWFMDIDIAALQSIWGVSTATESQFEVYQADIGDEIHATGIVYRWWRIFRNLSVRHRNHYCLRLIHDQKQKAQRKRPSILPSSVRLQAIARLRLVWADYQKRVFLLSNLPVEMPVDHLIEFNDLMPDRLEMELIKTGDLPLTPLGLEKMRSDLGYAGAKRQPSLYTGDVQSQ